MFLFQSEKTPSQSGLVEEKTRSDFSLVAFAFLCYSVIGFAVIFGLNQVLRTVGFFDLPIYIENQAAFAAILSTIPMYLFGLPVFFWILKRKDQPTRKEKSMPISELIVLFFISRFLVTVGSLLSSFVIPTLETVTGETSTNTTSKLVTAMPIWLMFLLVVIIAPIVEEMIFRRAVIDRLSGYGRPFAVLFSALIFGLAHGNFYQFFYTFLLGLLLGYLYAKTGKILYTVIFHMVTNFLGSVAVMPIEKLLEEYTSLAPTLAENPDMAAFLSSFGIVNFFILLSYVVLQYGTAFIGLCFFVMYYQNVKRFASEKCALTRPKMAEVSFINLGFILFFAFSVFIFIYEF